jgi:hypothetical protein
MITLTRATTDDRLRGLLLGGAALATSEFVFHLRDVVAMIVNHFGVSMAVAFVICSLILENSVWLMWVFPYMIPFAATVEILAAAFGVAFVAGW